MSDREQATAALEKLACPDGMRPIWLPELRADVWRYIKQLESQLAVPEGWRLVPVEPTEAMLNVGHYTMIKTPRGSTAEVWRAMLAAALATTAPDD